MWCEWERSFMWFFTPSANHLSLPHAGPILAWLAIFLPSDLVLSFWLFFGWISPLFFFFLIIIFWWVLVLIKVRAEGPRNEIYLSDLPSIKNQDSTSPPLLIVIIKNNKIKHIMDVLRNWVNNILKMKIDWRTRITIL